MYENSNETVEQLIRKLEEQRFEAIVQRDFDQFVSLAHPDLVYVHSSGVVDSLAQYLEKCRSGYYVYQSIDHPIDEIRQYGDTVLVIGGMNADLIINGEQRFLKNKSLAIWTMAEGRWKFTVYQATPIR
jgi:hypothetical protein